MSRKLNNDLIDKYLDSTSSEEEKRRVEIAVLKRLAQEEKLRTASQMRQASRRNKKAVLKAIQQSTVTKRIPNWLPYAAALLMIFGLTGTWIWNQMDKASSSIDRSDILVHIDADSLMAADGQTRLTLANGHSILLDQEKGIVIGSEDIRYDDGEPLIYTDGPNRPAIFATLETSAGGMYHITLSDGTKVWLNADSKLTYPDRFDKEQRTVWLEGEAYFEVTKSINATAKEDFHVPFRVVSKDQVVEVLGTSFNISAYPYDPFTSTTLVEGSVRVHPESNAASPTTIYPGQQITWDNKRFEVRQVDADSYIAWKENLFYFDRLPTHVALVQIARWYNIDVQYQGDIPHTNVFAVIDRKKSLAAVLQSFRKSGLHFDLVEKGGRRVLLVQGD